MYEIIIDYFEDVQDLGEDTKKQRQRLLHWWNRYGLVSIIEYTSLIPFRQVFPQTADVQKNASVRANSMALLNRVRGQGTIG
jgi:hypothetical protein